MGEDYTPESTDILCGRGNVFSNHQGNRFFETLVRDNLRKYAESKSRPQKIKVVDDILRTIRISGARFAKIDASTKRWYELNDVQAHQKIGHAIRDTIRLNGKHAAKKAAGGNKGNTTKKSENKPNSQALAAIRQARTVRRQQQEAERIQLGRRSSLESVLSTSLEADDFFMVQRELEQIRRYSKDKYDRPDEMASIYQYPTSIDAAVDGFRAVSNESAPPAPVATITPTTSSNSVATVTTSTARSRRFLLDNEFPEQNINFEASHFFDDTFGTRRTSFLLTNQ